MIDVWRGGLLVSNGATDPRPEPDLKVKYEEWMAAIEWCHIQTIGSAMGGFNYEVWAHKGEKKWIMCIDDGGGTCYDVLVEGLADYLDIMAMMAPIATASMLEGDTLGSIFAMHRKAAEHHKEMQKMTETITERVTKAMTAMDTPCDCESCIANRKDAAAKQAATAN